MTTTDTIKALRDALTEIQRCTDSPAIRAIAKKAGALTADASEDAPRQITYCEEEWITKTDWVQTDFQKDLFPLAYLGQHRADIMRDEIARLRRVIAHSAPVAATPAPDDPRVDNLRMLVQRLARSLSMADPSSTRPAEALDYLERAGLKSSPLRAAAPAAPTVEAMIHGTSFKRIWVDENMDVQTSNIPMADVYLPQSEVERAKLQDDLLRADLEVLRESVEGEPAVQQAFYNVRAALIEKFHSRGQQAGAVDGRGDADNS